VGEKGERISVFKGKVRVKEATGEGEVLLAAQEQVALGQRGRLSGRQPLGLPWVSSSAGFVRREAAEEPFFGELGRFRDLRYQALVDTRRDALANPARVSRLLQGEGFGVGELAHSRRQGHVALYSRQDLKGISQQGLGDLSEASDSLDVFRYQALDDGRWAGALRLQRVNLRKRDQFQALAPAGALTGGEVRREGTIEGPGFSAQLQRSWKAGGRRWGVGLLHQVEDLRGLEAYAAPGGATVTRELASTEVLDRRTVGSLGYSWDLRPGQDLGVVLRLQERESDRSGRSHLRNSSPVPLVKTPLLDRSSVALDALWRCHLSRERTLGVRVFAERARAQRLQDLDFDLTRLRVEDELSEVSRLYGLSLGLAWLPRRDMQVFADLGWQRLSLDADLVRSGGPALTLEERETRTSLHLGVLRGWEGGDVRLSLQLLRVEQEAAYQGIPGAGVVVPPGLRESSWRSRYGLTLGRWLKHKRRLEFEFEEREQESPERLLRVRLVRPF
jgi:hypothetical protein